ncbi:MAG: TRAP transporter small permease [Alphaproteobacteria bacterium]|nr:TRAP transporter small permease [Alphaproteobacteria bacterium]
MLQAIDRTCRAFSVALVAAACVAVILMALHVSYDVVARGIVSGGIYGTTEIVAYYYMIACVCLPLAYIELRDEHITVEVFYDLMPGTMRKIVLVFSILCTGTFFAAFAWRSWLDALSSFSTRERLMGIADIQIWPARFFLPISFALLVFACVLRVVRMVATWNADTKAQTEARSLQA